MKLIFIHLIFSLLLLRCNDTQKTLNGESINEETTLEFYVSNSQSDLNLPFSEAVRVDNVLYLSGQIGTLPNSTKLVEGGIGPETKQTMENIKAVLENNGLSIEDVFKCTCMLADIDEWNDMNIEYIKYFPKNKPARSAFAGSGLALGARVEIECLAYISNQIKK